MPAGIGTVIADELRFLTFRATGPGPREQPGRYLAFGLAFAWLAGIGRYWDNPRADWWQYAGLGSVAYCFVLAAILWAVLAALRPAVGGYRNVLLFVAMTSPPAVLYAIPVERFLDAPAARSANAWFLGVVAVWRVALWAMFLWRTARLGEWETILATLLPIALVVVVLAMLNLEHVVFRTMGGMREDERSPNDAAYGVVVTLSWISMLAVLPLLFFYSLCAVAAHRHGRDRR